jgi:hypothetical protein
MPFQKGQRANPHGRPPKARALTAVLAKQGEQTVEVNGRRVKAHDWLAAQVWTLVTHGAIRLGKRTLCVHDGKEWFEIAKWLYTHIDGPPRAVAGSEAAGLQDYVKVLMDAIRSIYVDHDTPSAGRADSKPAPLRAIDLPLGPRPPIG